MNAGDRDHARSGVGPIARLLSHGAENALTRSELEALTGWSGRQVRRQIERERRDGVLILSDCSHGYFLPGADTETAACIRSMRRRAGEIMQTAKAMGEAYDEETRCRETVPD